MTAPAVTCVIPTHARVDFLEGALESIAAQTLVPAEVIVVSDVPDEEAKALCASFAQDAAFPVTFLHCPDQVAGASASRNTGTRTAATDIVALLDDDDRWEPTYLELAVRALTDSGADMAVTWLREVYATWEEPGLAIPPGLTARQVVAMNRGSTGSNMVFTRASFDRIDGFDEALRVKNDTDFFYRFLKAGGTYAVVEERLVQQTKHQAGQLTGHTAMRADGLEKYLRKHHADFGIKERRELRMWIHYIRSNAATSRPERGYHLALAGLNAPPSKLLRLHRFKAYRARTAKPGFAEDSAPRQEATSR